MKTTGRIAAAALLGVVLSGASWIGWQARATERDIRAFEHRVASIGARQAAPADARLGWTGLPAPVQRYFRFTFPGEVPRYGIVRIDAAGDFRRPRTEGFQPTTARQVIAAGVPALMFSATTPVLPGVHARAYDFFADGQMEMKARILSAFTVVDERQSQELNRVSLRRWLLESALYPAALLPGGAVDWQPIDEHRARAVVAGFGTEASLVAHFADDGRMTHMAAETDGDLGTPYHGSGEHVARSDYRRVGLQMIPMRFEISRMAGGRLYPFWRGQVDAIAYE
jgi:hypothetical protein